MHPTKIELSEFLQGKLPGEACDSIVSHLESCPPCQETIRALEPSGDTLLEGLKNAPPPTPAEPECERAIRQAAARMPTAERTAPPAPVEPTASQGVTRERFITLMLETGIVSAEQWPSLERQAEVVKATDAAALARVLVQLNVLTKLQATGLFQNKTRGLVFGEYVVLDRIGAGGMGQVFKARHRRMDRLVALKVMSPAAMKNADAVKRFEREVRAAAKLAHPNIVHAYDAGQQDGMHFLVMEFVDGPDLSNVLKKQGPFAPQQAAKCLVQAARALAFAHGKGVVHRDIKPGNMLIDHDGTVKLLDLGLARMDDPLGGAGNDGLTQTGQMMGTVDYMAPEQAYNTREAGPPADVYSLGCSIYRLVTGESVYPGESSVEKILAHREKPIPSLRQGRPAVSPAFDQLFQRMLAKQPGDRPTMAQVVTELEAISEGIVTVHAPVIAREGLPKPASSPLPASLPKSAAVAGHRSPPRKNRRLLVGAGAAGFLLMLLGIWVIVRDKDGNEIARVKAPEGATVTVQNEAPAAPTKVASATPTKTAPAQPSAVKPPVVKPPVVSSPPPVVSAAGSPPGDYALSFGNDSSVVLPESLNAALDLVGPMTIETWVMSTATAAESKGDVPVVGVGGNSFGLYLNGLGNWQFRGYWAKKAPDGSWYTGGGANAHGDHQKPQRRHLAYVRTDKQFLLFKDGVLTGTSDAFPQALALAPQPPITIGGSGGLSHFHGLVDEVRFSKVARYTKPFTPSSRFEPDADTTALYHFDEGTGDVLHDASGNKHDGKIVGAKWVRADGGPITPAPSSSPPPGDYALHASKVSTGLMLDFSRPFTFEAYITPSIGPDSTKVHQTSLMVWNTINLLSGKDWSWRMFTTDEKLKTVAAQSTLVPQPGVRTHVAGIYTPQELRLYVNGKKAAVQDLSGVQYQGTGQPFSIGYGLIDQFDEVRVSQVARYDKDFTPQSRFEPDADTLLLFHCDEGTGDVLHDASGNKHEGTIIGAKWVRADGGAIHSAAAATTLVAGPSNQAWNTPAFQQWMMDVQAMSAEEQVKAVVKRVQESNPSYDGWEEHKVENNMVTELALKELANISPVRALLQLKALSIRGGVKPQQQTTDLSSLQGMSLTAIDLRYNYSLTDLSPLKAMPLQKIDLQGTAVTDLSPLRGMPLTYINLTYSVSDLSPLEDCKSLIWVYGINPNVPAASLAALQKALPKCSIHVPAKATNNPTTAPPLAVAPFDSAQAKAHQAAWAQHLGTTVETTNSVGAKMILIPPGEFLMGSSDEQIAAALKEAEEIKADSRVISQIGKAERPQHKIVISQPLLMSATEVTIGQFKKFAAATGYQTEAEKAAKDAKTVTYRSAVSDALPACLITWNDATAYCQWLSTQEKTTYRLPTEAEWEYACRAGTTTQYSFGDDMALLDQYGWYTKNYGSGAHSVGTVLPNNFGLFDMHGSLAEWCSDYYDEKRYEKPSLNDPNGPSAGSTRVMRGGYWGSIASQCRCAYRYYSVSSFPHHAHGFRVVRELAAPASTASVTPQPTVPAVAPPVPKPTGPVPPLAVAPFDAAQAKAHQAAWAKHLGTTVETTNSVGAKMILIPPGEFLMGSTDEQVAAALKEAEAIKADQAFKDHLQTSERPQHQVSITKPFRMGATEVTVGQFKKFVAATGYQTDVEKAAQPQPPPYLNPGYAVTDDSPAAAITWDDAAAYCKWLSDQEKTTYRLPTEAEWEYACRAGTTTRYSFGDDVALLPQYSWQGQSGRQSHAVGTKLPNGFGLFDMHGNVQEWCGDFYVENGYGATPQSDPTGPAAPSAKGGRVMRGGHIFEFRCHSAYHSGDTATNRRNFNGFRVVREMSVTPVAPETVAVATVTPTAPVLPVSPSPANPAATATQPTSATTLVCERLLAKLKPVGLSSSSQAFDGPDGDGRRGANGFVVSAPADWQTRGTTWHLKYLWSDTAHGLTLVHPLRNGHVRVQIIPQQVNLYPGGAVTTSFYYVTGKSPHPLFTTPATATRFPLQPSQEYTLSSRLSSTGAYELLINNTSVVRAQFTTVQPQVLKPPFKDERAPATMAVGQAAVIIGPRDAGRNEATEIHLTSGNQPIVTPR